jgi:hypothetical protein
VPLFVIVVLQDVHLKMAVVLSTALCICLAVGNYWFHRMQVVKVSSWQGVAACRTSKPQQQLALRWLWSLMGSCAAGSICCVCSEFLSEAAAAQ